MAANLVLGFVGGGLSESSSEGGEWSPEQPLSAETSTSGIGVRFDDVVVSIDVKNLAVDVAVTNLGTEHVTLEWPDCRMRIGPSNPSLANFGAVSGRAGIVTARQTIQPGATYSEPALPVTHVRRRPLFSGPTRVSSSGGYTQPGVPGYLSVPGTAWQPSVSKHTEMVRDPLLKHRLMTTTLEHWYHHLVGRKGEPWEVSLVFWSHDRSQLRRRVRFRFVVEEVEWVGDPVRNEAATSSTALM